VDEADYELPLLQPEHYPQPDYQSPSADNIQYISDASQFKSWSCIYPIYFDISQTRPHRKISLNIAVHNPLAKTINDVCRQLGYACLLEPMKTHPCDWGNPGRVRVATKGNKHKLYRDIAEGLRQHPTTINTPMELPVQGIQSKLFDAPHIPKGMKLGTILPMHSPALSGGGISDNIMKDMMGSS